MDVLDKFGDYENPPAQLRLTRLHGRGGVDLVALNDSPEWKSAIKIIQDCSSSPGLQLDA